MDCSLPGSSVHGDSPGKNTGVGCHSLLQRIFQTQGSNPGLPHCKQSLYYLSHKGSPSILEWVAYPFTGGSSQPRNWTHVACIWRGFFTIWVVFAYLHFLGDSVVKKSACQYRQEEPQETSVRSLGRENPLKQGMAIHPSILAWEIPWKEEPGRLQSMGPQRVGLNFTHTHLHITCAHPPAYLTSSLDYL